MISSMTLQSGRQPSCQENNYCQLYTWKDSLCIIYEELPKLNSTPDKSCNQQIGKCIRQFLEIQWLINVLKMFNILNHHDKSKLKLHLYSVSP